MPCAVGPSPTQGNSFFGKHLTWHLYCVALLFRIVSLPALCSGHAISEADIQDTWRHVYHLHFLKRAEQTAQKCQRGFVLRQHSPEVIACYFSSMVNSTILYTCPCNLIFDLCNNFGVHVYT